MSGDQGSHPSPKPGVSLLRHPKKAWPSLSRILLLEEGFFSSLFVSFIFLSSSSSSSFFFFGPASFWKVYQYRSCQTGTRWEKSLDVCVSHPLVEDIHIVWSTFWSVFILNQNSFLRKKYCFVVAAAVQFQRNTWQQVAHSGFYLPAIGVFVSPGNNKSKRRRNSGERRGSL